MERKTILIISNRDWEKNWRVSDNCKVIGYHLCWQLGKRLLKPECTH